MALRDRKPEPEKESEFTPHLTHAEEQEVEERSATRVAVVHEAIRKEGEDELRRPNSALAWSGLAAGLSMGFSLVTEGLIRAHLPVAEWTPLLSKFGYSIGFLVVVLGRQQLFTENTLTPILPLMARRDLATLFQVIRLWSVVLVSNLVGTYLFAWVLGNTGVFDPDVKHVFGQIGEEALRGDFGTILLRGVFAGWLIALMVWLLPVAETARHWIIIILTYVVGLASLSHIVAGSVETLYLVNTGAASWGQYFRDFLLPTLLGNVIGGVTLVAGLNHAQSVSGGQHRS